MIEPSAALPGRSEPMRVPERHEVLGTPLRPPFPEGVETAEQAAFLREHDCDEMQGYHFSRPIVAAEIGALLKARG